MYQIKVHALRRTNKQTAEINLYIAESRMELLHRSGVELPEGLAVLSQSWACLIRGLEHYSIMVSRVLGGLNWAPIMLFFLARQ